MKIYRLIPRFGTGSIEICHTPFCYNNCVSGSKLCTECNRELKINQILK